MGTGSSKSNEVVAFEISHDREKTPISDHNKDNLWKEGVKKGVKESVKESVKKEQKSRNPLGVSQ